MPLTRIALILSSIFFLSAPVSAAKIIDWTAWNPTWIGGNLGPQTFSVSPTLDVTYTGSAIGGTSFLAGTPDVLVDSPPGFPFNGTGGAADDYLDIYQGGNVPGEGSIHTFSFSSPLDRIGFTIWDIDSSLAGDNYVDELTITATLQGGTVVTPTYAIIANPSVVQQIDSDTWSAIPGANSNDNSNNGNLEVVFGQSNIESIRISYINSLTGPTLGIPSGDHAIGFYDIDDNVVVVDEPTSLTQGAIVSALCLVAMIRRRRKLVKSHS